MTETQLFGISVLLSFLAWGVICRTYLWPRLRNRELHDAARPILFLHVFRFVGAAFLIPGVVGPSLPAALAAPAAYGDLASAGLAWIALALGRRPGSLAALWVFNVWGTVDLLHAFYEGIRLNVDPSDWGTAFLIITVLVPLLLCTHAVLFVLLVRRDAR
jgi:hypothetical protein